MATKKITTTSLDAYTARYIVFKYISYSAKLGSPELNRVAFKLAFKNHFKMTFLMDIYKKKRNSQTIKRNGIKPNLMSC